MKIQFPTREDLVSWLKKTTSAVLLSISLVGGVQEVYIQASSARALANITQSPQEYFEQGAYIVEYEESSEDEGDDIVYTNIATAFTVKAGLAQHPEKTIGGLDSLREALSDFEYTAKIELKEVGYVGHLLVAIPESPEEIESLRSTLHQLSVAYILPDGTGSTNENNIRMGKGLWA